MNDKNNEIIEKRKKPFYKKWWFIVIAIILALFVFIQISEGKGDNWSELELGKYIPIAKKGKLDIGSNLSDYLSADIENVSKEYYHEYKDECIKMGYSIEGKSDGDRYEAFNNEGYKLSLSYYSNQIWILLKAPEKMQEFEWSTMGVATRIPKPKSLVGKVLSDTSNSYQVLINNMTISDFNDYVKECKEKGFIVDYYNSENRYEAKDSNGYRLNVSYEGNNRVDILIQTPEKKEEYSNQTNTDVSSSSNSKEIRKEFKDAMDSYEKYMDEYVSFMKKYKDNSKNASLLKDYTNMLEKYNQMSKDFANWENKDLNKAEKSYYLDVQTRVTKKLLEISD